MALGKQAKILTRHQAQAVLSYLETTRHPERNRVIFLLSLKAGLRAKEIANLTWSMLTDVEGELTGEIRLTNEASKGRRGGRVIPLSKELKSAISKWKSARQPKTFVVTTERSPNTSPQAVVNLIQNWYKRLGFEGASSHSGRRTAITQWARSISQVGGSLRDVQLLAGHSSLATTQRYIESGNDIQIRVIKANEY